jgi:Domain of unknown function (DUF4124)
MIHAKPFQAPAQLALQIACFVAITFTSVTARAEMYQCVGPDGSKSFSDQPCPAGHRAKAPTSNATAAKSLNKMLPKMSIAEAWAAKEAAGKDFMIKYYAAMTPECQKFAKAKPDDQARRLSEREQVARDGFKSQGCDAMVAPVQAAYKDTLEKIEAATDKPSERTPECKKLADQLANIFLNGVTTDAQLRMFEHASKLMTEQKCDSKLFDEAAGGQLAAFKAESDRLEKNPCEMKRRFQDALRQRQSGATAERYKGDIASLEVLIADLAKKCP